MAEPNPEDPLMTDISNEFKHNRALFEATAKKWTDTYAKSEVEKDSTKDEDKDVENKRAQQQDKMESKSCTSLKRTQPMVDRTNKVQKT